MAERATRGRHLATREPAPGRHLAARKPARRRWALAAAPVVLALTATAVGLDRHRDAASGPGPVAGPISRPAAAVTAPILTTTTTTAPPLPELPRGGRRLFPRYR